MEHSDLAVPLMRREMRDAITCMEEQAEDCEDHGDKTRLVVYQMIQGMVEHICSEEGQDGRFQNRFIRKCSFFVGCLTSQQHASVSRGRICTDNFACCHTEMEVADQTFYLTQSQYSDSRPTSTSADPKTLGAWSAKF